MIVLRGGRVIDPRSGTDAVLDVAIDGDTVVGVGAELDVDGRAVDCRGLIVAPGFVDLHVHLREPGGEDAETVETGSRAAAAGGFTAICAMPNTEPALDDASSVEFVWQRGREVGLVDVFPIGAVTAGRKGERLSAMMEMHRSRARVRMFSDDGDPVPTAALMRRALEYVSAFDGVIIDHAEDPSLRTGEMNEGEVSALLGLEGTPAAAEEICIARDLALAKLTGARLHIAHLSTASGAALVAAAKAAGVRVTCEVTPHHLCLTDEAVRGFDPAFKVAPALRTAADVEALRTALADGSIDCVATDHAPHPAHAKDREFSYAPCGMVGLETALGVVMTAVPDEPSRIVEVMSSRPAEILGADDHGGPIAEGRPANIVVFDPEATWSIDPAAMVSQSRNTPFIGRKLQGRVVHTMLRGSFTYTEDPS